MDHTELSDLIHNAATRVRTRVAINPPVGALLADLLDHIADDIHDDRAVESEFVDNTPGHRLQVVDDYGNVRRDWTAAVALSRSLLGHTAVTA